MNFLLNLHVGPKFTALHLHRVWNPYTFRARQIPPSPENLGIWKIQNLVVWGRAYNFLRFYYAVFRQRGRKGAVGGGGVTKINSSLWNAYLLFIHTYSFKTCWNVLSFNMMKSFLFVVFSTENRLVMVLARARTLELRFEDNTVVLNS